jgi:hypothetical protein
VQDVARSVYNAAELGPPVPPLAGHADDHAAALKNYKPFLVAPTGIESDTAAQPETTDDD